MYEQNVAIASLKHNRNLTNKQCVSVTKLKKEKT